MVYNGVVNGYKFLLGALAILIPLTAITTSPSKSDAATSVPGTTSYNTNGQTTDPTNVLTPIFSQTLNGGYIANGIGLRNLGSGTIVPSTIPAGSSIVKAYLLWDILDNSVESNLSKGYINNTPITGTLTSIGASPCWPANNNYSFYSDVTSIVANAFSSNFKLSGFASGSTNESDPWIYGSPLPEIEGASLVIIYSNPNSASTTVDLSVGSNETDSGTTLTQDFPIATKSIPSVNTTYIVADGQGAGSQAYFDNHPIFNSYSGFSGSDELGGNPNTRYAYGNLWDTYTQNVSSLITPNSNSLTAQVVGYSDCLVWVGQVVSATSLPSMVGLGDSYSSGEGNPTFISGTATGSDNCHRSDKAYANILASYYNLGLDFYACSGAKTGNISNYNINNHGQYGEPLQLNHSSINPKTPLTTITIGGNDIGFSSTIEQCAEQTILNNSANNSSFGAYLYSLIFGGADPDCVDNPGFISSIETKIVNLLNTSSTSYSPGVLVKTFNAIRNVTYSSNSSAIVADYPQIFPANNSSCLDLSPYSTNDQTELDSLASLLDDVEALSAFKAGLNFVDVQSIFKGHEVCGNNGAWINGLSDASGDLTGSFHPNATGHRSGYAKAIENFINQMQIDGVPLTSYGFPEDPQPNIDPPANPAPTPLSSNLVAMEGQTPKYGFGKLTITADEPNDLLTCQGAVQPGQIINIQGSGFKPNVSVKIYIVSTGLNKKSIPNPVTSDSSGNINVNLRIPIDSKGFPNMINVAGVNTLFINAIGNGSDSSIQNDIEMLPLYPVGGNCGQVSPITFKGFLSPVNSFPNYNIAQIGSIVPFKFETPGVNGQLSNMLMPEYPQVAQISCNSEPLLESGATTQNVGNDNNSVNDIYHYNWNTSSLKPGCYEFIVRLIDGSYHRALFNLKYR